MNNHTYIEKRASKKLLKKLHNFYEKATNTVGENAKVAVHSAMRPIYTARYGIPHVLKYEKDLIPGVAAGYTGLGYGTYKGGKKMKEYLQNKKRKK